MIKFYYHPSPNPLKVALYLEETGTPYEVVTSSLVKFDGKCNEPEIVFHISGF